MVNFSYWQHFSTQIFASSVDKYFHEIVAVVNNDAAAELRKLVCERVIPMLNAEERVIAWNSTYAVIEAVFLNHGHTSSVIIDEDFLARLLRLFGEQRQLYILAEKLLQKLQASSQPVRLSCYLHL